MATGGIPISTPKKTIFTEAVHARNGTRATTRMLSNLTSRDLMSAIRSSTVLDGTSTSNPPSHTRYRITLGLEKTRAQKSRE